mgnify:CR=1 FL=1|jgi:predicted DNA-binding protein
MDTITVRLSKELGELLAQHVQRTGHTRSFILREALRSYVAETDKRMEYLEERVEVFEREVQRLKEMAGA